MMNKQVIKQKVFSTHRHFVCCVLCVVCCVLYSIPSYSQDDENLKGKLEITKDAKIELGTANRKYEKINNTQPVQNTSRPLEYNLQDVELIMPKLDTKVKVVTVAGDPLKKLYGNYVKAGFGNYTTPYFEGYFNNKRSEKASYGAHLKHFSSANGPVDNSGFSENLVEVFGKSFGKKTVLKGNAGYLRNRYNFYGYDHAVEAEGDSLKQIFSTVFVGAGIANKNKQDKFNYDTDINYYSFSTFTKARESEVLWNLTSDYRIDNSKTILLGAGLSVSKRTDSSSIGRTLFTLQPAFRYTMDKLSLTGGFNVAYANDTISGYPKFHLYPRIHAEYNLAGNKLIVFGGLDGNLQKNNLRTFSRENPYLASDVALFHTNRTTDFYGGIKGGLSGAVNYKIRLSSANYKYLYFFNNGVPDTSMFTVLYEKNNVNVLSITGEVGYELSDRFRLGLMGGYYGYTMSGLEKPWHRPNSMISVLATYNLSQKVYFNADFYYLGGLTGKNYVSDQVVNLPGITDLNLKIDYTFSKVFSAFVEVNNILSKKYQRYTYYPVKGINVLAGLTYSF